MRVRHRLHLVVSVLGLGVFLAIFFLHRSHADPLPERKILLALAGIVGVMGLAAAAIVVSSAMEAFGTVRRGWRELQKTEAGGAQRVGLALRERPDGGRALAVGPSPRVVVSVGFRTTLIVIREGLGADLARRGG